MNTPREDLQSMMNDAPEPLIITIEDRIVFGQVKYYPACPKAQIFADMLGQTTFTVQNLKHILRLGVEVRYKHVTPEVTL